MWQCQACTLNNEAARTICAACGANRATNPSPSPSPSSSGAAAAAASATNVTPTPPPAAARKPAGNAPAPRRRTSKPKPKPQPKPKASEDARALMEMGFPRQSAEAALKASGNDRQRALDWLLTHPSVDDSTPASDDEKSANPPPSSSSSSLAAAVKQVKLSAAEERVLEERERLEHTLKEEEAARRKAFAAEEVAKHNKYMEQAKEHKKEEERQHRRQQLEREKARAAKKLADEEARAQRRREQERRIPDTRAALAHLQEFYDLDVVQGVAQFCGKIARNILKAPKEEKYRSVRLDSETVKKTLVRPLGGMVIMREMGFRETQNAEGKEVLQMRTVNTSVLKEHVKLFAAVLAKHATIVPQAFGECDEMEMKGEMVKGAGGGGMPSSELLYYCALDLRRAFQNVLAGTESQSFRQIDTEAAAYKRRLSRFPPLLAVLKDFGYEPENAATSVFLEVRTPDLAKFEAAIGELTAELNARAARTPIAVGMRDLLRSNPEATISLYVEKLDAALARIVGTPHEQKFHRIKLTPFFKRMGVVDGGKAFLRVFNFQVDDVTDIATLPYPKGFDRDLLEHRLHDFRRAYKVELMAHRQRQQQ